MHVAGINWAAVLVAALAFAAIGYLIHMRLVDMEAWNAAKHVNDAQLSSARMAFGLLLPLATAIGLAILFRWAGVAGVVEGVKWALVVALASALPALWYNWFYGTPAALDLLVDSAHLLIGHAVAGAILAGWR